VSGEAARPGAATTDQQGEHTARALLPGDSWRSAALELQAILEEEDAELQRAYQRGYEAGIWAGRLAAQVTPPPDRAALIEDGRRAGLVEGFAHGVRHAESRISRVQIG
jgi:hypothetical protein